MEQVVGLMSYLFKQNEETRKRKLKVRVQSGAPVQQVFRDVWSNFTPAIKFSRSVATSEINDGFGRAGVEGVFRH